MLTMFYVAACSRDKAAGDTPSAGAFLNDASAEAREALSASVNFELNEDNFSKWETAQRNLERLPKNAVSATTPAGGNVIDRAVARLESSPRARTAIESAGLSVRDFVLATIALAQATQGSASGQPAPAVPAANFAFVERHRERIRNAQKESTLEGDSAVSGLGAMVPPDLREENRAAREQGAADAARDSLRSGGRRRQPPADTTTRDSLRDSTIG